MVNFTCSITQQITKVPTILGIERKNDTINFNKFGTRLREIYDEIHKKNLAIF